MSATKAAISLPTTTLRTSSSPAPGSSRMPAPSRTLQLPATRLRTTFTFALARIPPPANEVRLSPPRTINSGFAGRYGGEEFLLLLPDTSTEDAAAVAEKIRALIAQTVVSGVPQTITASLGVACFP